MAKQPKQPCSFEELDRARLVMRRLVLIDIMLTGAVGVVSGIAMLIYEPRLFPPYGLHFGGMGLSEWILAATIVLMLATSLWDSYRVCAILRKRVWLICGVFFGPSMALAMALDEAGYRMKPFFSGIVPVKK